MIELILNIQIYKPYFEFHRQFILLSMIFMDNIEIFKLKKKAEYLRSYKRGFKQAVYKQRLVQNSNPELTGWLSADKASRWGYH